MERYPSQFNSSNKFYFCCRKCQNEWQTYNGYISGDKNPMRKPEIVILFTGKNNPMKRPEVSAKFLGDKNPSKRDDVRAKISANNGMHKPGIKEKHLAAVNTPEYSAKMTTSLIGIQAGDKHWNWQGGISAWNWSVRNSLENSIWRRNVLRRDNYTCRKCDQTRCCLEVHHQYNFSDHEDLRFVIANGIAFCEDCHGEFHSLYGNKNNTPMQVMRFLLECDT